MWSWWGSAPPPKKGSPPKPTLESELARSNTRKNPEHYVRSLDVARRRRGSMC